ncbi:hypothetical protein M9435_005381 [Picochlorum sp. BPE23]|nr:hypothetical protein M9435_005381 [Picochlorum sp. BPE23]
MATGFGLFQQQGAATATPSEGGNADKKAKLAAKITALNDQFLKWVQDQNTKELWLDGVEDYIEYAKEITKEFKDVIDGKEPEKKPVTSGFFDFTAPQAASGAPPPTISTYGATTPSTADNDDEQQQQNEDEDELVVDTSKADVLYSMKLHLLTQDAASKKWKDKGTGIFSLRQSKPSSEGEKAVSYIVFAATSGKVLINAPVVKGLKPMINPKSPANVVMFLISKEEDGSEKKEMHLFKCGSPDVAKEVVAKVSEQA